MQAKIEEYFDICEQGKLTKYIDKRGNYQEHVIQSVPQKTELALHLGFAGWRNIKDTYGVDPDFSPFLTRAEERIKATWIKSAAAGTIDGKFAAWYLSADHGMVNRQAIDITDQTKPMDKDERRQFAKMLKRDSRQAKAESDREAVH